MKVTTLLFPALFAMGGLVINCSSSDGTSPIATAGATAAAGMPAVGGAAAGAPASGGAGGGDVKCVPGSSKDPMSGMCVCHPATDALCSDGCYDTTSEPDHCGTCMTACAPTQACAASKCTATPTTLVPAAAGCGTLRLALAGTKLFYTNEMGGTVSSVATTGGMPTQIAMGQMTPTYISANGTTAYWANKGNKTIMKSGSATALVTGTTGIGGMTLSADGMTLYFADGLTVNSISTTATDGKATKIGSEDSGIPHALAVENNVIVYPTELNNDVDAMSIVAGTPSVCASDDSTTAVNKNCVRLSRSQAPNYEAAFLLGGKAYWTNQTSIKVQALTATTADTIANASGDAQNITALSISGTTAAFASDDGQVYAAPLTVNAKAVTIARTAKPGATSVATDGTNVYYAGADCAIYSAVIPK